jgi:hypothetical protein
VVGIVIGTMTLTGIGTIFGNWVVSIGRESLIMSLVLTMIVSLILGMGIPTIPNYIITSSLAAPALLTLGVPLIVSHMFVFYFGIMADLTPPVALAAFAAAPIAKASGFRIGFAALRIALPGFVLPYMAVYDPALMMQPVPGLTGWLYWADVAYMVVKAGLAVVLWGTASVGYLQRRDAVVGARRRCRCRSSGAGAAHDRSSRLSPDGARARLHSGAPSGGRRRRPVICLWRLRDRAPHGGRDHARLDAFGGKDRLGGGLALRTRRGSNSSRRGCADRGPGWSRRRRPSSRTASGPGSRTCRLRRR